VLQGAKVTFGEHRGQHELWGCAGRRWRCDAGKHIGGDLIEHLVARLWRQLPCAVEELAGKIRLFGGEPRQL